MRELKGWNFIVFMLIKNNFKTTIFTLDDLYSYEKYFQQVYPSNFHIKDKLRQVLQNLRNKGMLLFVEKGKYQLLNTSVELQTNTYTQEVVYLLSNEAIPGWVKIGRTNAIQRRLKDLYNTSVPLPFKVIETISTDTVENSRLLEKSIHSIIDTLNPELRKNTDASRREFFKLSPDDGKQVFKLVTQIMGIQQ